MARSGPRLNSSTERLNKRLSPPIVRLSNAEIDLGITLAGTTPEEAPHSKTDAALVIIPAALLFLSWYRQHRKKSKNTGENTSDAIQETQVIRARL